MVQREGKGNIEGKTLEKMRVAKIWSLYRGTDF